MSFKYSANNLTGRQKLQQRLFEILPGVLSWTILLGVLVLSYISPVAASVAVILFLLYWIYRLLYMTIFLILSYFRLEIEKKTDWIEWIRYLEMRGRKPRAAGKSTVKKKISQWIHKRETEKFFKKKSAIMPRSEELIHLVIIPVAKELPEIVEPGIKAISDSSFSAGQILIVLAVEERASEEIRRGAQELMNRYKSHFMDFRIEIHPSGIEGEAKVKGANATYAARKMKNRFDREGIGLERVIVSCFDADTVVHSDYFACLSYHYLICPDRERAAFQPIPVYTNNIWDVPGFARVLEMGASFFQLIEATNPEKLVTFSSHSLSFKALADIDYWPVDMISDDSSIFWKAYVHYDGDYRVVPMYVKIFMDVVDGGSWWKTAFHVYKQKRRWAWGIENFPILMRAFIDNPKIRILDKMKHSVKMLEGHVSWATWAILLSLIGWLPALYAGREFSETVLYYSAPRITDIIFKLSSIALLASILLSLWMLPKKKIRHSFVKRCLFAVQWFFLPFSFIFLSALPALDAQTRLMLGKRMEFWVSDKTRKKSKGNEF